MYGGDGFWMFADPSDPDYIYAEAQGGDIGRVNRKTHETRDIQPLPGYKEGSCASTGTRRSTSARRRRARSTSARSSSSARATTARPGSASRPTSRPTIPRSRSRSSRAASPSTTPRPRCTPRSTRSPSRRRTPNVIWVGTDDGNVQVTRDGGKTWTNVVGNIAGPAEERVGLVVEAGHFDAGTAYATFDRHTFGDMKPYVYKTTRLRQDLDGARRRRAAGARLRPRRQGGPRRTRTCSSSAPSSASGSRSTAAQQWAQYKGGDFPNVAVRDLAIHPRDHDLVIATHGRGIWIVDDITPLRALTPDDAREGGRVRAGRADRRSASGAGGGWVERRRRVRRARTRRATRVITYYQKTRHIFGDLKIEVLDAGRQAPRHDPQRASAAASTASSWSMRVKPPARAAGGQRAPSAPRIGPRVLPGTYTVQDDQGQAGLRRRSSRSCPTRAPSTRAEDRKAQFDLAMKLYAHARRHDLRRRAHQRRARWRSTTAPAKLPAGDALAEAPAQPPRRSVDDLRKKIVATKEGGMITGEERLREYLTDLYGNVVGYEGRPSQTQVERADALAPRARRRRPATSTPGRRRSCPGSTRRSRRRGCRRSSC